MTVASAELSSQSEVFPHDVATRAVAEELEARGLPAGAFTRLRRLARGLAPFFTAEQPRLLVLAELTAPSASAIWLSTALAEVLGVAVEAPLHLLIAGAEKTAARAVKPEVEDLFVPSVERLDAETLDALTHAVEKRIRSLHSEGRSVLLYRPHASRWIANFEPDAAQTGCLLLARAAKTRKAAVQSFQARLAQAGLPLLGAVLLDREYPIPEAIYRLL